MIGIYNDYRILLPKIKNNETSFANHRAKPFIAGFLLFQGNAEPGSSAQVSIFLWNSEPAAEKTAKNMAVVAKKTATGFEP